MASKTEPRIVLYDIETLPILSEAMKAWPGLSNYPGLTLKASINSVICFGHQVFGEEKITCLNAWDYKSWRHNVNDDEKLVLDIYEILLKADAVVTHNGKRFDAKFLQTRFLKYGLAPLPKIPHIDTCQLAKSNLLSLNNRLGTLGQFLVDEDKLENGGWELWVKVMNRDADAMELMTKYCKQDVKLLRKIFKVLRPLATNIPNYHIFTDGERIVCPKCGSTRMQKRGYGSTKVKFFQKLNCNDCGSWCQMPLKSTIPR